MSYRRVEYEHSNLPNLSSVTAEKLSKQLYDEWKYRDDMRQELTNEIWPACDDAFSCRRDLPRNKGMTWADKSDFGDTDIRDGVLFLANAMVLSLMPPDDSWLELYSYKSNDQWRKNKMRDYQQFLHRRADTRGHYESHITQALVRGCSAITWEWRVIQRMKRMSHGEAILKAAELEQQLQMPIDANLVRTKDRTPYTVYNGPCVSTLDMYDVYPDPCTKIGSEDMPVAVMTFRTMEELKYSKDEEGNPLYSNLKDLNPCSLQSIYKNQQQRYRSLQTLGINPMGFQGYEKNYVPVLVFHRQLQKLDNSSNQWVDTFFEIALTDDFAGARLIRCYENPSDYGNPAVFFDSYSDFIAQTPYQTGVVEKALPAWQAKNVISALTLQSMLVHTFPAMGIITSCLKDTNRIDVSAGGLTLLNGPAMGTQTGSPIIPLLPDTGGTQQGMQEQQFMGQKILGSMGAYGAIMQSPDRSITRAKTATQINTEGTTSSIGRDNLLQKFVIRSLEPLAQAILHASIQYNSEDIVQFERTVDGGIIGDHLTRDELDLDWRVVVTGQKAKMNKAQEMQELQQIFQYVTTASPAMMQSNPMLMPMANKILMTIVGRLGMKDIDQYEQDPVDILLRHPVVGQQIQQALMKAFQMGASGGLPPGGAPPGMPQQGGGNVLALPPPRGPIGQEVNVA